jgi:hypothetical protein
MGEKVIKAMDSPLSAAALILWGRKNNTIIPF